MRIFSKCFFRHKWSEWIVYNASIKKVINNVAYDGIETRLRRNCLTCNKTQDKLLN